MSTEHLLPEGESIRKAVKWISEVTKEYPEKNRKEIIHEAELRYDLSPKECDFLFRKFV
ncbi:MAG: hypothetical protein JRJ43_07480 [Deltaproteobacteria bacterium]|nr:hypothetical protein [Deltaproteobacteria bacterium]MBW1939277.1 hypothetical protein [Deltaproteobacteria bacterium]